MKLPQVLLLPFGMISDCFPIRGQNRKPYFLVAWRPGRRTLKRPPYLCARSFRTGSLREFDDGRGINAMSLRYVHIHLFLFCLLVCT